MDEVLCRLALADGELAMPNGNDWSMFLYDQITSYTTAACFLRDPNALMTGNLAYKHIKPAKARHRMEVGCSTATSAHDVWVWKDTAS